MTAFKLCKTKLDEIIKQKVGYLMITTILFKQNPFIKNKEL